MAYSLALQPSVRTRSHLKNFSLFPTFPLELQRKVWSAACFIPRVVPVACNDIGKMPLTGDRIYRYSSPIQPPIVLQVCKESRKEGLRHYKREFAVMMSGKGVTIYLEAEIYINFAADTIWPIGSFPTRAFEDFCKRDIQHIAISISPFEDRAQVPESMVEDISFDYLRVKTITLCHPSCFDPRVTIGFEAVAVKDVVHLAMTPKESHYGLVWAKDEIDKSFGYRVEDCAKREKRNTKARLRGLPGSEQTFDETIKGPWKRPEVRIMTMVQQRPAGWPVHGWFVDGVDQFQPED